MAVINILAEDDRLLLTESDIELIAEQEIFGALVGSQFLSGVEDGMGIIGVKDREGLIGIKDRSGLSGSL